MAKQIQTFGYEGQSIEQFIARLKTAGTAVVIDVRATPLSRKPGFSKKAFALHLHAAGIEYVHAVGVGCPKPVRDRYKDDGDWSAYTIEYLKYLRTRASDVEAISAIARDATSCLVCFEADFSRCHRSFVADTIAAGGKFTVEHLTSPATTVSLRMAAA
jgi:uncharacterized protein (DUF488 family)